jgi:threonine/homoserine/homoserine lactone efflux protein
MLGPVIGDLLPSCVGLALSPFPIVAVVLLLATPRGRTNGPAFAAGWVVGLIVVSVVVLLVAGGADDPDSGTSTVMALVKIGLAGLLLKLAKDNWDKRSAVGPPQLPKWMDTLETFTTARSFAIGAALSGINPKNLALTVAAMGSVAQAGLSSGGDVVAVTIFVVLGSLTIAAPVVAYLVLGERAEGALTTLREWMAANNPTIMMVICLVFAAKLFGGGLAGLTD